MITVNGSKLIIPEIQTPSGTVSPCEIDLTPYQGRTVRVYIDSNLNIVINPTYDCYWQIAELVLPSPSTIQVESGTIQKTLQETIYITRGEQNTDEIQDISGKTIEQVGFYWQNYQKDIDYIQTSAGIKWLSEHKPEQGTEYPVTLSYQTEETAYETAEQPLDLSTVDITLFDLPSGGES